ncbi:ankyrin repeat and SOCS box protein 12-like isoform X1 [Scleropages formosus]|nr:ankyrin repeat and SOCS box protein 12-like isoform X1 [Scleropages formosus]
MIKGGVEENFVNIMVLKKIDNMSLMDVSKIISMLQPSEEEEERDSSECRELNRVVSKDDDALLSMLLSQECYKKFINSRCGWGVPVTPLRLAASLGHLRCLEMLLSYGAEVDSLDVKAQTPLFSAVSGKHVDCVAALLKAGANPNGSLHNNCSPVLIAARDGDVDILHELLQHGAEVNVRPKVPDWVSSGSACRGPLYLAAVYGHLNCFKLLLLYGADPNYNCTDKKILARIKQPNSVLETCLRYGCGAEYVQLLIDFGANIYLPTVVTDKTTKQNKAIALLLKERVCPKTLMCQTRLAIRSYLPVANKMHSIDLLNIPLTLRNYLKHIT